MKTTLKMALCMLALGSLIFLSCKPRVVTIPTQGSDLSGPGIGIMLSHNDLATNSRFFHTVNSTHAAFQDTLVVGAVPAFWALATDTGGVKMLIVTVANGSILRQDGSSTLSDTLRGSIAGDTVSSRLSLGGKFVFDSLTSEMTIEAMSIDWSDNQARIQTITLFQRDAPTARLTASNTIVNPNEDFSLHVTTSDADDVYLNGTLLANHNEQLTRHILQTTTYILEARSNVGSAFDTLEIGVRPPPAAPTISEFSASPSSLNEGNSTQLRWSTSGATSIEISENGQLFHSSNSSSGTSSLQPSVGQHQYRLTAFGQGGTRSRTVTVNVTMNMPPDNCISTPNGFASFYRVAFDNTSSLWEMNLTIFGGNETINTIQNENNYTARLEIGTMTVFLSPGETTTAFRGLRYNSAYYVLLYHIAPAGTAFCQMKICLQ